MGDDNRDEEAALDEGEVLVVDGRGFEGDGDLIASIAAAAMSLALIKEDPPGRTGLLASLAIGGGEGDVGIRPRSIRCWRSGRTMSEGTSGSSPRLPCSADVALAEQYACCSSRKPLQYTLSTLV